MIHDHVAVTGIGCSCLDVEVKNPRTHIDKGKALYTDYEIELKTNHPSFPLLYSKTRRRYSEFIWLRSKLGLPDVRVEGGTPKLPGKQLIGRFKESFLQDRKDGLQRFLSRLLSVNAFLQEPALQLFLQTKLEPSEMDHYIKTRTPGAIKSLITRLYNRSLKHKDHKTSRKYISREYPSTTRRHKHYTTGGRGWSSQYGDGYYTLPLACKGDSPSIAKDVRQRSSTVNAGRMTRGRLPLPSIPDSIVEEIPLSSSDFTTTDEEADTENCHPLSASWHGCEHDQVDFILDDYEVIPYELVTQMEEQHQAELEELGYLDLTPTTTDQLSSFGNEQECFDF